MIKLPKLTPKYKTWSCGTCASVLGMLYTNGVLAIKHKEFYCWITGDCEVICRRCGSQNKIQTISNIEDSVGL